MTTDALERLAASVPPKVREVCTTLASAGHQAVIVGGCVRDVLMNRTPGDWDVASSAHPDDVMKLFKRTVPQGLQHGTVKVLMGKGKENEVEVTTFRGEGAYSDARRPDSVTFGVPLVDDLARRDLVVNAIAYDPARNEIVDPFGGQQDILARRLRAVGTPVDRFTEDGLRVMRAVRFAAQLEFELDPDTEAGIPPALPSLSKVSRERVCEELRKLLGSREPSRGLRPAVRTGILANILPELVLPDLDAWLARIDRAGFAGPRSGAEGGAEWIDRAGFAGPRSGAEGGAEWIDRAERDVRLAALVLPLPAAQAVDALKRLKFSNAEVELVGQLLRIAGTSRTSEIQLVRHELSRIDKAKRAFAVQLWRSEQDDALVALGRQILDEKHPLGAGDLAMNGGDLMRGLDMKPGPAIGRLLERLVNFVIEDPARNTRDALLAEARVAELEIGLEAQE